jgi:hypothetical protein
MGRIKREPPLSGLDLEGTLDEPQVRQTHWMEEIVTNAMKSGDFDDLPGKGKPLKLDVLDPYAGPDAEAMKILKQAGFAPQWIDLRKQIIDGINWLRANPTQPDRLVRLTELNSLISDYNRMIPSPSLGMPKVPIDFGIE